MLETMERYDVREQIGEGTFGTVHCALKKSTGDKVRALHCKGAERLYRRSSIDRSLLFLNSSRLVFYY